MAQAALGLLKVVVVLFFAAYTLPRYLWSIVCHFFFFVNGGLFILELLVFRSPPAALLLLITLQALMSVKTEPLDRFHTLVARVVLADDFELLDKGGDPVISFRAYFISGPLQFAPPSPPNSHHRPPLRLNSSPGLPHYPLLPLRPFLIRPAEKCLK